MIETWEGKNGQSSHHSLRLMNWRVYIRKNTKDVDKEIARMATATMSPLCEGGLTKFDFPPCGGFTPGVIFALDVMVEFKVPSLAMKGLFQQKRGSEPSMKVFGW